MKFVIVSGWVWLIIRVFIISSSKGRIIGLVVCIVCDSRGCGIVFVMGVWFNVSIVISRNGRLINRLLKVLNVFFEV